MPPKKILVADLFCGAGGSSTGARNALRSMGLEMELVVLNHWPTGYDILFRMLEPHELAAAMGFNNEETKYEFAGTKTDQIKQIGNAVPVGTATALVGAIMSDAAEPKKQAA